MLSFEEYGILLYIVNDLDVVIKFFRILVLLKMGRMVVDFVYFYVVQVCF